MRKEGKVTEDHGHTDDHIPSITNDSLIHQRIATVESEKLDNNMLEDHSIDYDHPLQTLLKGAQKDGYTMRWEVFKVRGVQHLDALYEASRLGWTPVPISRASNNMIWDDFGKDELSSKYIVYKDVMLMEIPTHLYEHRQKHITNEADRRLAALEGVENDSHKVLGSIHRSNNRIQNF